MNEKKIEPLFDYYGSIIVIRYLGLAFLSVKDAETIRSLREEKGVETKDECFSMTLCGAGRPDFVNVQKTLENNGIVVYYSDDEIQWSPTPIEEYNP
jgi:hypothetical protein